MRHDHGYPVAAGHQCEARIRYGDGRQCLNDAIVVDGAALPYCFHHWRQPDPQVLILKELELAGPGGITRQQLRHKLSCIGQEAFEAALGRLFRVVEGTMEPRPNRTGRNQKQVVYRLASGQVDALLERAIEG